MMLNRNWRVMTEPLGGISEKAKANFIQRIVCSGVPLRKRLS